MGGPVFLGRHLEKTRASAGGSRGIQLETPWSGGNDWRTARERSVRTSGRRLIPGFPSETPAGSNLPTQRCPWFPHLPLAKLRNLAAELRWRCRHSSEKGND